MLYKVFINHLSCGIASCTPCHAPRKRRRLHKNKKTIVKRTINMYQPIITVLNSFFIRLELIMIIYEPFHTSKDHLALLYVRRNTKNRQHIK